MKTISAKELRDNLEQIGRRVSAGEHIKVTYRNEAVFIMMPDHKSSSPNNPGDRDSMHAFVVLAARSRQKAKKSNRIQTEPDLTKVYWEDMAKKYDVDS